MYVGTTIQICTKKHNEFFTKNILCIPYFPMSYRRPRNLIRILTVLLKLHFIYLRNLLKEYFLIRGILI